MPTTTYLSPTLGAFAIGARTDAAGGAVPDLSAREARLAASPWSAGVLGGANSWRVRQRQAGANMSVDIGSGVAYADTAVVRGDAQQGAYFVQLDASLYNVTVPAASLSQARVDEVYLVVRDNPFDASSRALPQIGYRRGDDGGGAPGPDGAWTASLLLATIAVAANETQILDADITDGRAFAGLLLDMVNGVSVEDHGARHGSIGDDQVMAVDAVWTDNGNVAMNTTWVTRSTISFAPPAHWNTFDLVADASVAYQVGDNASGGNTAEQRVGIGGVYGASVYPFGPSIAGGGGSTPSGHGGHKRTGLSGSQTIVVQARRATFGSSVSMFCQHSALRIWAVRRS